MHFRGKKAPERSRCGTRDQMFSWETMLIDTEDCFTGFRKKRLFVIDQVSQIKCLTSTCFP